MPQDLISGTLHLAPIGPQEWSVSFLPSLDIPRGTSRDMLQTAVLVYLRELGIEKTLVSEITNFDFSRDELRPTEVEVIDAPRALLRRLGLISDRYRLASRSK